MRVAKKINVSVLVSVIVLVAVSLAVFFLIRGGSSDNGTKDKAVAGELILSDPEQVLMWEVTKPEGGKVYMAGSIHVGKEAMYPLNKLMLDAFDESEVLAVETDVIAYESNYVAQLGIMQHVMYMDGTTLADHISSDLLKRVDKKLSEKYEGMAVQQMHVFDAMALQQILLMDITEGVGLRVDLGIDRHFLEKAKERKMPIVEIESVLFQMKMMKDLPDETKELMIRTALDMEPKEAKSELIKMIDLWMSGRAKDFEEYVRGTEEADMEELSDREKELYREYNQIVLTDRNVGMADKVEELLKDGRTCFYVVGAAHYFGEDGIIDLLVQRGYTVKKY